MELLKEKKKRILSNRVNAILISLVYRKTYETKPFYHHVISNRVIHKNLDLKPYELWKTRKSSINYLKVMGYLAKHEIAESKI